MATKPLKGFKVSTDENGRQRITAKPAYSSVSDKIRQAKSKRVKVVRSRTSAG